MLSLADISFLALSFPSFFSIFIEVKMNDLPILQNNTYNFYCKVFSLKKIIPGLVEY